MRSCLRILLFTVLLMTQGMWGQRTLNTDPLPANINAEISVSPSSFGFAVPVNGTASSSLQIQNTGTAQLQWNIIESDPALVLKDGTRIPIRPYQSPIVPDVADVESPVKIGGPDTFGYVFIDSNEPGGPEFFWEDISTIGTQLTVGDEGFALIDIFFDFTFYGVTKTRAQISANGFLTFGSPVQQNPNPVIPDPNLPNDIIAPFWDDLVTGLGGGTVHVYEDFTNNRLIVQYTNVRRADEPNTRLTFQVIINENQEIRFQYLSMTGVTNSATIGIENATGTDGLQIIRNMPYVQNNLAVLITPGCSWLATSEISGTLGPSELVDIIVDVDATGLAIGNYECQLLINSNDATNPQIIVPVQLIVGPPDITVDPLFLNFGEVLLGQTDTLQVSVSNDGDQVLDVTDASISGLFAGDFQLLGASTFTVQPGQSQALQVVFNPAANGAKIADLVIASNDPDEAVVTVGLTGIAVSPDIDVTPPSHDFADVRIGENAVQEFVISNTGTADLFVDATAIEGPNSGDFSLQSAAPFVIPPQQNASVSVTFTPTVPGNSTATLRISNSDPDENPLDVPLSGTAVTPEISVSPLSLEFGEVIIGQGKTLDVTISNDGTAPLNILSSEVVGPDATDFLLSGGATSIPPSGSITLSVNMFPQLPGNKLATLRIQSDDLDEPLTEVALSGFARGIPDIRVVPLSANFGDVFIDQSVSGEFLVLNDGTDTLTANAFLAGNSVDFSIESGGGHFNVVMGDTHTITVRFQPTQLGNLTTILRIENNDPDENPTDVAIEGRGVVSNIVVQPLSINFGNVEIDTSADADVTIENSGSAPFEVTETSFSGADVSAFSLTGLTAPFMVNPGETKTLSIRFAPRSTGLKTADLHIISDAFNNDTVSVALTGNGTGEPDISATPVALDFDTLLVGESAVLSTIIANQGLVDLLIQNVSLQGQNAAEFSVERTLPAVIAAGVTDTLAIRFTPVSAGAKAATVSITSNDPDENPLAIALSGTAVTAGIAVEPAELDYGNVLINQQRSLFLSVSNPGSSNLNVSVSDITGTDAANFAILSGGAPFVVAPADTQQMEIQFSADMSGPKTASLTLTTNVIGMETVSVSLSARVVSPDIAVDPDSLDFGTILVNTFAVENVLVENTGDATLTVQNLRITGLNFGSFDILNSTGTFELQPGESDTVKVVFQPQVVQEHLAFLEIASDDPDTPILNIPLRGVAVPIPVPNIVLSSDSLGFGTVVLGRSSDQTLTITNTGTADLLLSDLLIAGATAGEFSVTPSAPLTVTPGTSAALTVTLSPVTEGAKFAILTVFSNDPDMATEDVVLTGEGLAQPEIALSAAMLDFGHIEPGDSTDSMLKVFNRGTAPLEISAISVISDSSGGSFERLGTGGLLIAPDDSAEVNLRFRGTTAGVKTGTLRITSNDPDQPVATVALTAEVVVPEIGVSPAIVNFLNVPIRETTEMMLKIFNRAGAGAELRVSQTVLTGDTAKFKLTDGTAPFTLQPGDTQTLSITFSTLSTDTAHALLSVISNDPDSPELAVAVRGNGIIPLAHDFIFLANERISYESFLHVEGDIYSNEFIHLNEGIQGIQNGNMSGVIDVELRKDNTVNGDIRYGDDVVVEGTLNGTATKSPGLQPIPLPLLDFTAGGASFTVNERDTLTLAAGSYDVVVVSGVLAVSAGEYFFNHLEFKPDGRLVVDTNDGLVFFNVVHFSIFRRRFDMNILPDGDTGSMKFVFNTLQSEDVEIGRNSRFLGSVIAPNAQVKLERETLFRGAICSKRVKLKQFAFAVHHLSPVPLPADSLALAKELASHFEEHVPERFELRQNYPNPFNPATTIEFSIAREVTEMSIKIYDITGRLVKTLVDGQMEPGIHSITWEGRNQFGERVSSGIYLYRMVAGTFVETRKMLLIK